MEYLGQTSTKKFFIIYLEIQIQLGIWYFAKSGKAILILNLMSNWIHWWVGLSVSVMFSLMNNYLVLLQLWKQKCWNEGNRIQVSKQRLWLLCWYQLWTLRRRDFLCSLCSLLISSDGLPSPLACDQSCKSCGPRSPRCLTCVEKTVLHDGKCISECPGGYYADATGRCRGKTWVIVIITLIVIVIIEK